MALVSYSDSEHSSEDEAPPVNSAALPASTSTVTKPAFQKVVDRSNPHKIRVNLPTTSGDDTTGDIEEPAAKRARRTGGGGGTFSGFNSLLPAPKRTAQSSAGGTGVKLGAGKGRGLGAGVSLKTGAAPGFTREPEPEREPYVPAEESPGSSTWADASAPAGTLADSNPGVAEEKKPSTKPMMFKPLSVARKPQKKKPANPITSSATAATSSSSPPTNGSATQPSRQPRQKTSLFSLTAEETPSTSSAAPSHTPYEPILYAPTPDVEAAEQDEAEIPDTDFVPISSTATQNTAPAQPTVVSSLSDLATDMKLSRSAKRQLLGRNGTASSSQFLEFNTDKEYAANDEFRRTADANAVHNPVKAIAPGKHSLKQLVNAASGQKDALEESFATGRRNRKEAGNRYGW